MTADLRDTDLGRVHFVGIGGAGMSGIARVLLARGATRVGQRRQRLVAHHAALTALGATVHVGHDAAHVDGADTVVVSTAIRQDNPELVAARERGLRVLLRAEALAALMAGRRGVAVAGTHGKTTTTSMLTVAVQHCGVDPSFAIGGDLNEAGQQRPPRQRRRCSSSRPTRATARSSPTGPTPAIVTNVEADHLDHYGDAAAVDRAFEAVRRAPSTRRLRRPVRRRPRHPPPGRLGPRARASTSRTYGTADDADLRLVGADRQRHDEPLRAGPARAPAAAGRRSACPAATWPSTPPARCCSAPASGSTPATLVEGLGRLHRRAPPDGAQGHRGAACASTTTTPTTRPS